MSTAEPGPSGSRRIQAFASWPHGAAGVRRDSLRIEALKLELRGAGRGDRRSAVLQQPPRRSRPPSGSRPSNASSRALRPLGCARFAGVVMTDITRRGWRRRSATAIFARRANRRDPWCCWTARSARARIVSGGGRCSVRIAGDGLDFGGTPPSSSACCAASVQVTRSTSFASCRCAQEKPTDKLPVTGRARDV